MEKHVLFMSPQFDSLARRVCEFDSRITLGSIDLSEFPDGWSNFFFKDIADIRNAHVAFLACVDNKGLVFDAYTAIRKLARLRPKSLRVLMPYFPTGTMEREDDEGSVATAESLAAIFANLPPAGPGPIPFFLWDLHTLQNLHYFDPNVLSPRGKSGTKLLASALDGHDDVSIVFPDEGAYKRYKNMEAFVHKDGQKKWPFIICGKERMGGMRKVYIKEGDVMGRNTVIVDDLAHSGGTLLDCRRALSEAGARSVSVYVTHGVFENGAWKKFVNAGFERIWTTDSCATSEIVQHPVVPFEILSLVGSISRAIMDP